MGFFFFFSTKILFSIIFPNFDGQSCIPANQGMRHWKCKGVSHCLAQTQPEWARGKERAFPSPDVSNKGQPKTQPWWDPTSPLSSGSVKPRARLLQWECCCSCHINQTRLRAQNLQQNQMAADGADNACADSPCAAPAAVDMQEELFIPSVHKLPKFVLSVGTGRLPQGKNCMCQSTR